ncbi:MAG: transposase [bacterium]|nr:transposase [bacterium]
MAWVRSLQAALPALLGIGLAGVLALVRRRRGQKHCGFVEGLNNKIKVIKRRCYGIFNVNHL